MPDGRSTLALVTVVSLLVGASTPALRAAPEPATAPMRAEPAPAAVPHTQPLMAGSPVAAQTTWADADAVLARALALERQGQFTAALALLWEAAGLAPRDADLQNRLGEALERIGALDAAIDAYGRAVSARPAFTRAVNNLVLALVASGRHAEARELARTRLAAAPADPERHYTLGLAQSEQDVDAAIASFRRVLALSPRHTLARYNLALALKRLDRPDEAAAALREVLRIEPRPEAHYSLGVILWQQGNLDGAERSLRAAIAAEPRHADAHATLGAVLKARRDWPGAMAALERAVALRPDLAGPQYTLAQVLLLAGDEAGARMRRAEADRVRQRTAAEQEARVWTHAGIRALDADRALDAIDHFRRATSLHEPYAPAHYHLGRALRRLGQAEAAAAAFARARQIDPSLVPPAAPH